MRRQVSTVATRSFPRSFCSIPGSLWLGPSPSQRVVISRQTSSRGATRTSVLLWSIHPTQGAVTKQGHITSPALLALRMELPAAAAGGGGEHHPDDHAAAPQQHPDPEKGPLLPPAAEQQRRGQPHPASGGGGSFASCKRVMRVFSGLDLCNTIMVGLLSLLPILLCGGGMWLAVDSYRGAWGQAVAMRTWLPALALVALVNVTTTMVTTTTTVTTAAATVMTTATTVSNPVEGWQHADASFTYAVAGEQYNGTTLKYADLADLALSTTWWY